MSAKDTYNKWVQGQNFEYPRHLRENEVLRSELQSVMSKAPTSLIDAYAKQLGVGGTSADIARAIDSGQLKMYVGLEPSEFNYAATRGQRESNMFDRAAGFYQPRTAETDTARVFFPSTDYTSHFGHDLVGHELAHEIFGHEIGDPSGKVPDIDDDALTSFSFMGYKGDEFPTPNEILEDAGGDTLRAMQEYRQIYGGKYGGQPHDAYIEDPYGMEEGNTRFGQGLKSAYRNFSINKNKSDLYDIDAVREHTHYHPDMTDRDFKEAFAQQWFDNTTGGLRLKMANPDLFERRQPAPEPVQAPTLLPSAEPARFNFDMDSYAPDGDNFFDFLSF